MDEKERICKNIKEMDEKEMQRVSDSGSHDDNASIRSKQRMHGLIRACRRHLRSLPSPYVGASGDANAHHFSGCPNILRSFFVSAWSMCRLPAFPVAIRHVEGPSSAAVTIVPGSLPS